MQGDSVKSEELAVINSTISDVERETGLAKETLRVWERRYGFPMPLRDALGERIYSSQHLHKLRLVKRLLDLGHRPGKIIHFDVPQLQALSETVPSRSANKNAEADIVVALDLQPYLDYCKEHQVEQLRRSLSQALLQMGLRRFVLDLVAPLNVAIGMQWASGKMAIFEEHLYTESLIVVMRNALSSIPRQSDMNRQSPRVLLTTLPQERHGLGLLMVEALVALEGGNCISLGVQTPVADIVDAAKARVADIVALSFSSAINPRQAIDSLKELRQRLPQSIEIWAGGRCPGLAKNVPPDVHILDLGTVATQLDAWRGRQK